MARVVKEAAVRQDEILDIAERLFWERGYDTTPIQAIIDAAGIAKGTFYHHYPSKSALLDAVVQRYTDRAMAVARAIVEDPAPGALEKLRRLFVKTGAWKTEHRAVIIALHRALNQPANAAMYARMQRESLAAVLPLITTVIEAGVQEGVLHTRYPRQTARMMMDVTSSLSMQIGEALLGADHPQPTMAWLDEEIDACHDAINRLLGLPPGQLPIFDRDVFALWLADASAPTPRPR